MTEIPEVTKEDIKSRRRRLELEQLERMQKKLQSQPEEIKTVILTGAGASAPFGIPAMATFLDGVSLGSPSALNIASQRSKALLGGMVDIEEVMFFLQSLKEMNPENLIAFPFLEEVRRGALGSKVSPYEEIKNESQRAIRNLQEHVHKTCSQFETKKIWDSYKPLFKYAHQKNNGYVFIFTTNYDTTLEYLFLDSGHRDTGLLPQLEAGFQFTEGVGEVLDPRKFGESLRMKREGLYLFKLHGSLGWRYHDRLPNTIVKIPTEERSENSVLIYPNKIKKPDSPFRDLYDKFDEFLLQAEELLIIGCSLRDDGLKARIQNAYKQNADLQIHLCDPKAKALAKSLPAEDGFVRIDIAHNIEFGSPEFEKLAKRKFKQ